MNLLLPEGVSEWFVDNQPITNNNNQAKLDELGSEVLKDLHILTHLSNKTCSRRAAVCASHCSMSERLPGGAPVTDAAGYANGYLRQMNVGIEEDRSRPSHDLKERTREKPSKTSEILANIFLDLSYTFLTNMPDFFRIMFYLFSFQEQSSFAFVGCSRFGPSSFFPKDNNLG